MSRPREADDRPARQAGEAAAARRAVEGALLGARTLRVNALEATAEAAAIAVRAAARSGGDVASVARSAVEGAVDAAKALTVDPGETASAAARGALRGARESDAATLELVRAAVSGLVAGVPVVLPLDERA